MKTLKSLAIRLAACVVLALPMAAWAQTAPPCRADRLALNTDDGQGRFNGMSQSGMVLTVTNRGDDVCSLSARPILKFRDRDRKPLPITARAQPGMRPGPVLLPIVVKPHASVSSEIRWVSGNVYENGQCVSAAYVTLILDKGSIAAAMQGHFCGPSPGKPSYRASTFTP
ncbi:MAG TPA: DUF4232 domain-containing protein [Dyella sp.]|uniref:DUF4232 domain-containing protein n=1 Tax=Dyella sp. TaxID=1869338 RepID=UPI002F9575EA